MILSTSSQPQGLIKRLLTRFNRVERWLLWVCLVGVLGSGSGLAYQYRLNTTTLVPASGGAYREGIVATSLADVTPTISVLTKIGLTRLNDGGEFEAGTATTWQVSDDGKTYTFALAPSVDRDVIRTVLEQRHDLFPDSTVTVSNEGAVTVVLKQPFSPFLATTATPLFPYGPFQIMTQDKGIVRLKPNPHSLVGQPLLQEIVLRMYPDTFNLTQALASGEIDGVSDTTAISTQRLLGGLQTYQILLPRTLYLFFNTERVVVATADRRRALSSGTPVDGAPEIHLVTLANPKHEQLAQDIVKRWTALGVRVVVETHTATELATEIVPKRAYDALIYGLDFGGDPDPYPFWHSSQIGPSGLNLSNFANIDADRILEKARQTHAVKDRTDLYTQFRTIIADQVPAIELEQVQATFGVDAKLRGVRSHPGLTVADRYSFVTDWYRKTRRVTKP
ncbi:ABC transporter substrate-binding protein [Candidatus Berkelbacteria bacterium]|nr:ABC transporter substrate-binding protein [Candidatus Berkelbacteria bacterium]